MLCIGPVVTMLHFSFKSLSLFQSLISRYQPNSTELGKYSPARNAMTEHAHNSLLHLGKRFTLLTATL